MKATPPATGNAPLATTSSQGTPTASCGSTKVTTPAGSTRRVGSVTGGAATVKLRALLASAVSICGVSAATSAAGAVQARREQLAYAASLVIVFALPSIFILPWLAGVLNLSPAVTGAWIGGNIDTTAAVAAAGSIAGEDILALATIVKSTQNVLIGVVAIALTAYFTFKIERRPDAKAPGAGEIWRRFPKFVLGSSPRPSSRRSISARSARSWANR